MPTLAESLAPIGARFAALEPGERNNAAVLSFRKTPNGGEKLHAYCVTPDALLEKLERVTAHGVYRVELRWWPGGRPSEARETVSLELEVAVPAAGTRIEPLPGEPGGQLPLSEDPEAEAVP